MFSTPLRSLISKDLTNLFFAGRLASFSHVVYGSQRVMRTCAAMGQAAGTAAAYAVRHGVAPIALQASHPAVWSIQQQLLRDDAFIIGVYNADPRDHARTAKLSATTEFLGNGSSADGKVTNVVSGQSRAVVTGPTGGGVPPSQGINGTNRWISTALPAAITMRLPTAVPLAQIQLTFDTGMHRKLNFNPVGMKGDALHWGAQPETVRDYLIEGRASSDGDWSVLCNVSGNYQRRRVHSLPCTSPQPNPSPPPPPAPPVVANGALVAGLCTAAPGQMWSMDNSGTINSADGKFCLGVDANISAFGGQGKAVVALPCDTTKPHITWKLTPAATGISAFLETARPEPCRSSAACDTAAKTVSSITVTGAGSAAFNGIYLRNATIDSVPSFQKDASHMLHRFEGVWKLVKQDGQTPEIEYMSLTSGLPGPPSEASGWQAVAGQLPVPSAVKCQGGGGAAGPMCSCVHAVACSTCHPTGTGAQTYFPGTSVELADCSAKVTHIQWLQLEVVGGTKKGAAMLMSDGLCLGLPTEAGSDAAVTGRTAVPAVGASHPQPQLTRPSNADAVDAGRRLDRSPPMPLTEVRVTVTATNGVDKAMITEVRLYDNDGLASFPQQAA